MPLIEDVKFGTISSVQWAKTRKYSAPKHSMGSAKTDLSFHNENQYVFEGDKHAIVAAVHAYIRNFRVGDQNLCVEIYQPGKSEEVRKQYTALAVSLAVLGPLGGVALAPAITAGIVFSGLNKAIQAGKAGKSFANDNYVVVFSKQSLEYTGSSSSIGNHPHFNSPYNRYRIIWDVNNVYQDKPAVWVASVLKAYFNRGYWQKAKDKISNDKPYHASRNELKPHTFSF